MARQHFGIIQINTNPIRSIDGIRQLLKHLEDAYRGVKNFDDALFLSATGTCVRLNTVAAANDKENSGRFSLNEAATYISTKWDVASRSVPSFSDEEFNWKGTGRLVAVSIRMNSPGEWNFLGSLNPLEVLRKYLNDRHQRKLDFEYRSKAEAKRLELDNIHKLLMNMKLENKVLADRMKLIEKCGATPEEVRSLLNLLVHRPLTQLSDLAEQVGLDPIKPINLVRPQDPLYGHLLDPISKFED